MKNGFVKGSIFLNLRKIANLKPIRIAIFASGGGSNARTIIGHFRDSTIAEVALLVSNNAHSGIFSFGPKNDIPTELISKEQYRDGEYLNELMQAYQIDLIILAGYLKLIPASLIPHFPRRILNIHPALLPAYGGKGMYGMNVHRSIIESHERYSGITIHYVNEVYDQGEILFQASVEIKSDWSAEDLQKAVQRLEHQYFSVEIEKVCRKLQQQEKNT